MKDEIALVGETIMTEFASFNDLAEMVVVLIRLLLAGLLGGLLGFEREQRGKAAGLRTHMLVCMGAGTIINGNDEQRASGLTTAAGIWFTAAIGVAVGLGREQTAIVCTLLAWIVLYVVPMVSNSRRSDASEKDSDS